MPQWAIPLNYQTAIRKRVSRAVARLCILPLILFFLWLQCLRGNGLSVRFVIWVSIQNIYSVWLYQGFRGVPWQESINVGTLCVSCNLTKRNCHTAEIQKRYNLWNTKVVHCMYEEPYGRYTKAIYPAIQSSTLYGRSEIQKPYVAWQKNI